MLLPILEIRDALRAAVAAQRRFVLEAPTGSGKSTQVPQMLVDLGAVEGQVVVLQPRRVAARMLARRVAWERAVRLGGEVGYQVRFERVWGRDTRILYVTEGVLLRRMLDEPGLPGVGAILFDEFHERHLYGDITLAQALRLQRASRPDLLLGGMSATLDSGPLAEYLVPCGRLRSEGRTFPVDIRYAGPPGIVAREEEPAWDRAARECARLMRDGAEGDILIFMPGSYEIRQTIAALEAQSAVRGCAILPLHGELTPEQQDAAIDPSERRKIVVSTNVAETSLTIDGVRIVIDSGLARIPAFDANRGINTLLVRKISRASADQRAGRAGRTAPGICVRLWSQREHEGRLPQELPEVRRLDLSEVLLFLKASGVPSLRDFPWFEAPGEASLQRGLTLLEDLGALDHAHGLTPIGRRMAAFPLHPRYSRMLLEADALGCLQTVTLVAALSQGRSIVLPLDNRDERERREDLFLQRVPALAESDFFQELAAFTLAAHEGFDIAFCRRWGIHAQGARTAARLFEQLAGTARGAGLRVEDRPSTPDAIRKCILTGFSDQLARRLDRGTLRCVLVHNRRGDLRRESLVAAPLLVCAEIEERNVRGDVGVLLGMNTAIEEAWLRDYYPQDFSETREVLFDATQRRVTARVQRRFRDLVLEESQAGEPPLDDAARLLAEEIVAGRAVLKNWDADAERWIARCNFVARHWPEYEVAPIGPEERRMLIEQICHGAIGYKEVKDRPVMPTLRQWLSAEQEPLLDRCAPERVALPRGINARVRYEDDGSAILAATVQQLYDAPARLLLGQRVPAVFEILAPNRRPVQITSDLGAFWTNSYPEVKKQLKGRYPKHEWR